MVTCFACHHDGRGRHGCSRAGQQRCSCGPCHRDFTATSALAFSATAGRPISSSLPFGGTSATPSPSGRSPSSSLSSASTSRPGRPSPWTQTFGPQSALEARRHRRRLGQCWWVDEVFLFRGTEKRYLDALSSAVALNVDLN